MSAWARRSWAKVAWSASLRRMISAWVRSFGARARGSSLSSNHCTRRTPECPWQRAKRGRTGALGIRGWCGRRCVLGLAGRGRRGWGALRGAGRAAGGVWRGLTRDAAALEHADHHQPDGDADAVDAEPTNEVSSTVVGRPARALGRWVRHDFGPLRGELARFFRGDFEPGVPGFLAPGLDVPPASAASISERRTVSAFGSGAPAMRSRSDLA